MSNYYMFYHILIRLPDNTDDVVKNFFYKTESHEISANTQS